jgi:tyrosine-protein phosphatase non-receptor type 14/21
LESQLFVEFELIAKKRLKCECSIATLERNRERNRFKDVVPYDDNRVQLTPTKNNTDGYINASHIRMKVSSEEFWYIATQAPLANTVCDFWQMVWENGVSVIAMLMATSTNGFQDVDRQRCAQYWPDRLGQQHTLTVGDFEVSVRCSSGSSPYVTSGLLVRHTPTGRQRVVWHLQFTDWPDHGCPNNSTGFLDYLSEIDAIRRQVDNVDGTSTRPQVAPVVVHCSAGVGRTGVLVLAEIMKASFERNQMMEVPSVLKSLRDQRMYMVQTVTQYCFVYRTLVAYLQSSRLI